MIDLFLEALFVGDTTLSPLIVCCEGLYLCPPQSLQVLKCCIHFIYCIPIIHEQDSHKRIHKVVMENLLWSRSPMVPRITVTRALSQQWIVTYCSILTTLVLKGQGSPYHTITTFELKWLYVLYYMYLFLCGLNLFLKGTNYTWIGL